MQLLHDDVEELLARLKRAAESMPDRQQDAVALAS